MVKWSHIRSFVRDFVCITFVWVTTLWEQSETKLIQKKSHTKFCTRLHYLERLGLSLGHLAAFRCTVVWPFQMVGTWLNEDMIYLQHNYEQFTSSLIRKFFLQMVIRRYLICISKWNEMTTFHKKAQNMRVSSNQSK